MRIVYLDNSGFAVYHSGSLLLFDYYNAEGSGLGGGVIDAAALEGVSRVYVFVSHRHYDHFNRVIFTLADMHPDVRYILDAGIFHYPKGINITRMNCGRIYDDGFLRAIACPSTDIGVSFLVSAAGANIFHAGDFNCWHWAAESTPAEETQARADFSAKLDEVSRAGIAPEIMFFPIDPRLQVQVSDGALEAFYKLRPALVVPMHMQGEMSLARELADRLAGQAQVFCYNNRGDSVEYDV